MKQIVSFVCGCICGFGTDCLFVNPLSTETLCSNPFHITKYPTLKLIRYGSVSLTSCLPCSCVTVTTLLQVARKEYRGQRSVDAIVDFVRSQLHPPVEVIKSIAELAQKVSLSVYEAKFNFMNDPLCLL